MKLSKLIAEYRTKHELSMGEFAKRAEISKPYVSMLEKNQNSRSGKPIIPSLETLKKLAFAMQMTLDDLLHTLDDNMKISIIPNDVPTTQKTSSALYRAQNCLDEEGLNKLNEVAERLLKEQAEKDRGER